MRQDIRCTLIRPDRGCVYNQQSSTMQGQSTATDFENEIIRKQEWTNCCVATVSIQNAFPIRIGIESCSANVRLVSYQLELIRVSGQHKVMKVLEGSLKQC